MPEHISHKNKRYERKLVRDAVAGESTIKRQNQLYLPMPEAMTLAPAHSTITQTHNNDKGLYNLYDNPNYHEIPAYSAYKSRGRFPAITSFFLGLLVGLATRKKAEIETQKDTLIDERKIQALFKKSMSEVSQVGKFIYVVEATDNNNVEIVTYTAESMVDWDVDRKGNIVYARFEEIVNGKNDDDDDEIRHTDLSIKNGIYTQELYINGDIKESMQPSIFKKTLDFIPLVIAGSVNNDFIDDQGSLYAVASIAIHVYMKETDLSNSEFMSANPTLIITGADKTEVSEVMGAGVAKVFERSDTKVFYTTTDTSAMAHNHERIKELLNEAAIYGSSLINGKRGVESAESLNIQNANAGSSLLVSAVNVATAMQDIFNIASGWVGSKPIKFNINTEFADIKITPQMMAELFKGVQGETFSLETYLENARLAGLLAGNTVDQEIELLRVKPPKDKA